MPITHLPLDHLLASTSHDDFSARRALSDVSTAVAKSRKAIVVSGAGISCSSGIPDFRSADGLYSLVKARYPSSFVTGKDLFSSSLFLNPSTSSIFYTFIAELSLACQNARPTRTHQFIRRLEQKGKLLRSYTQNVDGLERRLGLESGGRGKGLKKKETKNVELHGDLGRVRCVLCMNDYPSRDEWVECFREGEAPGCPACDDKLKDRLSRGARPTAVGTLRPSIVLYDEPHPLGDQIGQLQVYDITRQPDLLLVMGTSLKVHGLKNLVKQFAKAVHAKGGKVVFVNRTPPSKEWEGVIDIHIEGETDKWVERVEEEWRKVRPQDWEQQTLLDGEVVHLPHLPSNMGKPTKSKGKKAATLDNDNDENDQLPTPPCSQRLPSPKSPERPAPKAKKATAKVARAPLGAAPDVLNRPVPQAPPTPTSPGKRRSPSRSGAAESPTKKSKAAVSALEPPRTAIPPSPGAGNLFSPAKTQPSSQESDNMDVFGSPTRPTKAKPVAKPRARKGGKENTAPGKDDTAPVAAPRRRRALQDIA